MKQRGKIKCSLESIKQDIIKIKENINMCDVIGEKERLEFVLVKLTDMIKYMDDNKIDYVLVNSTQLEELQRIESGVSKIPIK